MNDNMSDNTPQAGPPRPARNPKEDWIVVAHASGDTEAAIIQGALQSAGIPARVYREAAGAALGITIGYLGRRDILVQESDYDDALTLLEGDDEDDFYLDDGARPLDDGLTIDHVDSAPGPDED